jgi:D-alanyl-D-alanine carboxypeptidase/D-alanyl-D-alanine-endopeptidase (penicillin-binding protein 4)
VRRVLLAVLAGLLLLAPPARALDAAQLRAGLTREMRAAGGYSGAYARDVASGAELVAVRPDTPRIPASVEKLFVAATALLRFGADGTLATKVVSSAPVAPDGTLAGDVALVGGGDPTLDEDALRELAAAVKTAGINRVDGDVVADDSRFDRLRGGPRTNYAADSDIGGRLGALVLGRGFQPDPTSYVARRFAAQLRAAKITVGGEARAGTAPAAAVDVGAHASPSIQELVRSTLVPSDNFLAEMLLKDLGAEYAGAGSTSGGAAVVRDTLDDFGVRPRISDGSGLSRSNRTTPRQVVRLLERMDGQPVGATWRSTLAVAGRTGTVKKRMRRTLAEGNCHVKTGTIRGVSNLAGICTTRGGADVAFAWLMNGVNISGAHRIQDRMTALLAKYDG